MAQPPRNMQWMRLALLVLVLSPPSRDDDSPGMLVQASAADEHRATDGRTSVLLLMADDLRPVSCSLPPTEYTRAVMTTIVLLPCSPCALPLAVDSCCTCRRSWVRTGASTCTRHIWTHSQRTRSPSQGHMSLSLGAAPRAQPCSPLAGQTPAGLGASTQRSTGGSVAETSRRCPSSSRMQAIEASGLARYFTRARRVATPTQSAGLPRACRTMRAVRAARPLARTRQPRRRRRSRVARTAMPAVLLVALSKTTSAAIAPATSAMVSAGRCSPRSGSQ